MKIFEKSLITKFSVNKRHKIEIETVVRFVVKSFDEETLHLSGSLLQPNTGNVNWLDKYAEEDLVERCAIFLELITVSVPVVCQKSLFQSNSLKFVISVPVVSLL
ncbi:hypothetical protein Hanom_Chr02g00115511 [Helianthus anomalus]